MAVKYLVEALAARGADHRRMRHNLRIIVVDRPGPWFVAFHRPSGLVPGLERRDPRDGTGPVLGLDEVVGVGGADVVLASMVLRLVPPRALRRAVAGIARATRVGGQLLWTSPDSAPRLSGSVLFHNLNREVRKPFYRLRAGGGVDRRGVGREERRKIHELAGTAAEPVSGTHLLARRQIPDRSRGLSHIESCLAPWMGGVVRQITTAITDADLLRVA